MKTLFLKTNEILNLLLKVLKLSDQILDMFGKILIKGELRSNHTVVPVAGLSKGSYLLVLRPHSNVIERKYFIKY